VIKIYIDYHAHVFFSPIPREAIDEDFEGEIPTPTMEFIGKMITDAKKKGVSNIVGVISNPNDFPSYRSQLELENIIHVLGIQRGKALEDHLYLISLLRREFEVKLPHGIGEIGLDYEYGVENLNEQEKIIFWKKQRDLFRKQIRLAKEFELPIVVHAGFNTDRDLVEILKEEKAVDVGAQIHGYMSKKEFVSELLDMGFYFSFGYIHTRDKDLRKIVELVPLEQILTETDSPYHLIESPKRFIVPKDVVMIANEIAFLKEVKPEILANQVMKNAREIFRF